MQKYLYTDVDEPGGGTDAGLLSWYVKQCMELIRLDMICASAVFCTNSMHDIYLNWAVVEFVSSCFVDQEGGVSANIACSQSSMQVTWDIPKIFESSPQQTTQGVECVNMLQFNCTYNGTVVSCIILLSGGGGGGGCIPRQQNCIYGKDC